MEKKNFVSCEVEIVKLDEADIIAASPSPSCPSDGLFCGEEAPCESEDF